MRLVGAGAGWCYRPECTTGSLWHVLEDKTAVKLAEVAHIVAASSDGPRADSGAQEEVLASFDNLLLLCPNCHTIVDKAHASFPVELMQEWKRSHEARVRGVLEIKRFSTRGELNVAIYSLLLDNRAIWRQYGPDSASGQLIITDVSDVWRSKVFTEIIPNNLKIVKLLEANSDHLAPNELDVVAQFRLHAAALEERHLSGVINQAAPRFPDAFDSVFKPM
ncbi:HNH endonuclease [Amycolatopsis echigonensis]|uniref:HNH nuclease domain-containing protein n=1 Tax=Amycolatopsis echigonensis TaxID=2576905 RepID=A0A8E1VV14_9PSEU|nr:HNH endonuclease [Amycolatopsis echigonensis]MBB2498804.1 hypothetical protein [Amycolatopsis echigonensis]